MSNEGHHARWLRSRGQGNGRSRWRLFYYCVLLLRQV